MKSVLLTFLSLLTVFTASARVKFVEKNFADTVRIEYANGKIWVPVTIDGKTYKFWYDTGANVSMIPDSLADELFTKNLKGRKASDFRGQISEKTQRGVLREMQIGHLHLNGVQSMAVHTDRFILGAHELYLSNVAVKIDLKKRIMIFSDRKNFFKEEENHKLPDKTFSLLTQLKFSMSYGTKGAVTFDTGNNMYFSIKSDDYNWSAAGDSGRQFMDQIVWIDSVQYAGYSGEAVKQEQLLLRMEEVKMGDLTFQNVPVEVIGKYSGFGCRMLEFGTLIADDRKMAIYYQPYTEGTTVDLSSRIPQLKFGIDDTHFYVKKIDTKSALYAAGVRPGARMDSLGGKPTPDLDAFARVITQLDATKPWPVTFRNADCQVISATVQDQQNARFFTLE